MTSIITETYPVISIKLIFIFFLSYGPVYSQVDYEQIVSDMNEVAQTATDAKEGCFDEVKVREVEVSLEGDPEHYFKNVKFKRQFSSAKENYNGDLISVLSEEEADKLFDLFFQISYMKFDYLHDGCFARAHEFALIAKENGIEMGKVFLSDKKDIASLYPGSWRNNSDAPVPEGFVGWRYHVAPYVLVKKGDQVVPVVFDVGVAEKPQTVSSWKKGMTDKPERSEITYKDRGIMFRDSPYSMENKSNIKGQLEDQELMRSLGIDEFIFRREQGWL